MVRLERYGEEKEKKKIIIFKKKIKRGSESIYHIFRLHSANIRIYIKV